MDKIGKHLRVGTHLQQPIQDNTITTIILEV